jgi:hypothetical protein
MAAITVIRFQTVRFCKIDRRYLIRDDQSNSIPPDLGPDIETWGTDHASTVGPWIGGRIQGAMKQIAKQLE